MPDISAVIGANYGDCGKGLITDYLSDNNTLVVRFNGGAQAGHTVVRSDGRGHVFHHFGAGTLSGADTYLARKFIVNPAIFVQELKILLMTDRPFPDVFVDPLAKVTTPYDMMLNQAIETLRGLSGTGRHGSCGLGINETVVRHGLGYPLNITAKDILTQSRILLRDRLDTIRSEYVPKRSKDLGMADVPHIMDERVLEHFLDDIEVFKHYVSANLFGYTNAGYKRVVFEGAQGLGLDEKAEGFPYVTRSRTGLHNVMEILNESDLAAGQILSAYYVTRPYLTRHGPGPLENELDEKPHRDIIDRTNVPNEWQGTIRYGSLEPALFKARVGMDLNCHTPRWAGTIDPWLAITCVDQTSESLRWVSEGKIVRSCLLRDLTEALWGSSNRVIMSSGRTKAKVYKYPYAPPHADLMWGHAKP
jgi:adenylosuccinate synthase